MNPERYDRMRYRRAGTSGLVLPAVSYGLWQGFGSYRDERTARDLLLRAFDHGITHFDLANNYGNPAGTSELLAGRIFRELPRDELIISTKAGYRMWPGPYGEGGSRKHVVASLDASLQRLGLDYVDIFYSHRPDPHTPIEETMGAIQDLINAGKVLYGGLSNYGLDTFTSALATGSRAISLHQPRINLFDRSAFTEVLPTAASNGVGVVAFSPLAQGILAGRYNHGIPHDSRISLGQGNGALTAQRLDPKRVAAAKRLKVIADNRDQSLAQLALAWLLQDPRITSVLIGASTAEQLSDNLGCLHSAPFSEADLADIDAACGFGP